MIGVDILENLILNVKTYSMDLNYIRYKKIVLSFINLGLTYILEPVINMIKTISDVLLKLNKIENLDAFEKLMKLLLSCFSFTFNLGYIDFENEWDLRDSITICVNKNYKNKFR